MRAQPERSCALFLFYSKGILIFEDYKAQNKIRTQNNNIMKFSKILAIAAIAALATLSSCEEKEKPLGAASISLDPTEVNLTSEAGAHATVNITATRQWTVNNVPDWITVTPNSGQGSNEKQTVTITAKSNPDIDRDANITFTIGFSDAVLKVKQSGEAGTVADALLYKNDFDKTTFEKPSSGWPYLDQVDHWRNETGNGIANVAYEFTGMSVRNNGQTSDHEKSLYPGSGKNFLFFGKTASFAVKNIALNGKTNIALSFGGERYTQDDTDNTYNPEEFKVFVSIDGVKGVELVPTFKDGTVPVGTWNLATVKFAVPTGTEAVTVVFKCANLKTTSTGGVYRLDDLQLAAASGGDLLDLNAAVSLGLDQSGNIPDSDEVTDLATIIAKPAGSNVTVLNATVTAVTTKGYVIGKGDKAIYVYKNADPKLAVGDKVSLIGTFKYYWGEYEITDASEKKTGTATPEYPTPVEINKDFLTRCVTAAATDEESTNYGGIWYPKYAHMTATVHKDGNYTQFKVEGYDGYLSFVSAPSAMFADESGTSWGEGNTVDVLGYYTGWESKNSYHQFIAVKVTGQATYTPVEAAVAGDDVFIAKNAAHDLKVANQAQFPKPIVIGSASVSFDGDSNTGKYYDKGEAMRVYKNSTLTVSSNKPIVKVEYLFAADDKDGSYHPAEADLEKLFTVGSYSFDGTKNILTWTGKAMEVVLAYPLTSGHYRFQQIGVTYGQDVEPRLSATPLTLSAKFNVQSNVAWTITSDKEGFVASPASGEGDAEITVSFPKNTSTENEVVAKFTISATSVQDVVVTLTQAKAVDASQATDLSTITAMVTDGADVSIVGATVAAVTTKGCILSDGTNHVYVYKNGAPGVEIGDIVNVTGKIGSYNSCKQISSPTITKTGAGTPVYGTPTDISETYATYSNANKHAAYVTFVATPKKSGNYTNLYFEGGDTPYASFVNAAGSLYDSIELGAKYKITGFYTGKASAYHQIVYVSAEKIGEAAPSLKVDKTEIEVASTVTSATVNVTSNVAWTATLTSGTAELAGADGKTGTSVTGNGDGRFMIGFAANDDTENAKTYTVTISGESVDNVVVTITQAKKVNSQPGDPVTVSVSMSDMATKYSVTTNGTQVGTLELAAGVVMSVNTDGNNGKFYSNGAEWRLYQTNNPIVQISVPESNQLVSVKFTYGQSNGGSLVDASGSTVASGSEVSLSGSTAKFSVTSTTGATNGQVKMTAVTIIYK